MSTATLGKYEVLSCELVVPDRGTWTAVGELDGDRAPSGVLPLAWTFSGTTITFVGFVRLVQAWQGRTRFFLVGGAGNLRKALEARAYGPSPVTVSVATVLGEILADAGERLSSSSVVAGELPRWARAASSARECLNALADRVGATWRVLQDGSIWWGTETWPPNGTRYFQIDDRGDDRFVEFAPDLPTLLPGQVAFGHRIKLVTYKLEPDTLRAEAHYE